jgi:hypothetical protein
MGAGLGMTPPASCALSTAKQMRIGFPGAVYDRALGKQLKKVTYGYTLKEIAHFSVVYFSVMNTWMREAEMILSQLRT